MKSNPLFWKTLVIVGIPTLAVAGLFPVFGRARENARRAGCQSNLKQIGLGFTQYAQDYDGRLPPVKFTTYVAPKTSTSVPTGAYGWVDGLQPYLKSICIFYCPSGLAPPQMGPKQRAYTNYWMNARLSGAKRSGDISYIVLTGDGTGADPRSTARYALSAPPDQKPICDGYQGACDTAWKHFGDANFLFVDGHVKALPPDALSTHKGAPATFAP